MKALVTLVAASILASTPSLANTETAERITLPNPPAGKAQMVFFRKGGIQGSMISCAVHEDNAKISSLPPARFFAAVVEPGDHTFTVSSEAKDQLFVTLKPGETQYAECNIAMGFLAGRPKLKMAMENEFRSKMWKSVTPDRMSPNVLTDDQIKAALAAQANPVAAVPEAAPRVIPASTPASAPEAAPQSTSTDH